MIQLLFPLNIQDLKDPHRKDDMAAARATLKESSKMLLSSSKVNSFKSLSAAVSMFVRQVLLDLLQIYSCILAVIF